VAVAVVLAVVLVVLDGEALVVTHLNQLQVIQEQLVLDLVVAVHLVMDQTKGKMVDTVRLAQQSYLTLVALKVLAVLIIRTTVAELHIKHTGLIALERIQDNINGS
jgi:hypothetical protein